MSRLFNNFVQLVDAVGDPIPGGKLHTYAAGGTTEKKTYPTEADRAADTNANVNPIVADAAGVLPVPVYMIKGEGYNLVVKDASDVTIRSEDDFYSGQVTDDDLITRVKQIASNPIDYGAVGDGSADEASCVQDAIDNVSGNGVVDLLGLTFRCDSTITVAAGVTIRNGTLDFSNCTDTEFLLVEGTLGGNLDLTADASYTEGKVSLTAVTDLAAGDLINILSQSAFITGSGYRGELAVISSIATLDVNLTGPVDDEYDVADNALAKKVVSVDDVKFEDLSIVGAEAVAGDKQMLTLKNCRRARVTRCKFTGIDKYGVVVSGSYDTKIDSCVFENTQGSAAIGVYVVNASRLTRVLNSDASGVDKVVLVGKSAAFGSGAAVGVPRDTITSSLRSTKNTASAHVEITEFSLENTVAYCDLKTFGSSTSQVILVSGVNTTLFKNKVAALTPGFIGQGIYLEAKPPVRTRDFYLDIDNNQIIATTNGIYSLFAGAGTATLRTLNLRKNTFPFTSHGQQSIELEDTGTPSTIENLYVLENVDDDNAGAGGGGFKMAALGTPVNNLFFGNNRFGNDVAVGAATAAVDTKAIFFDNEIVGSLTVYETPIVSIDGHVCVDTITESAVYIKNGTTPFTSCSVRGVFADVTGDPGVEIDADAAGNKNLLISGCNLQADDNTILVTGNVLGALISGNVLNRDDDAAPNVSIAGTGAGDMDGFRITGNHITNGTYGINVTNGTAVFEFDNSFVSMATGDINGPDTFSLTVTGDLIAGDDVIAGGQVTSDEGIQLNSAIASNIKMAQVPVSTAEVKALKATPKTIVAAVAGKILQPLIVQVQYDYVSAPYVITAVGDDLALLYVNGAGQQICRTIETTGLVDQAADVFTLLSGVYDAGAKGEIMATAECVNVPIVLANIGANELTVGDGELVITITYAEIPVA